MAKKQLSPTFWFMYFRIPKEYKHLHAAWKARCARRNQPMVKRFIEMMEEDVAKDAI